jgi:P pilus assembly chaperone PapD
MDEDGRDILNDTDDIVVSPKYIDIAPNGSAIILIRPSILIAEDTENAYRLLLKADPIKQKDNIYATFTHSLPIFVNARQNSSSVNVELIQENRGKILLSIANKGATHEFIEEISLSATDRQRSKLFNITEPGWYILSNHIRRYTVSVESNYCVKVAHLDVELRLHNSSHVTMTQSLQLSCDYSINETKFDRVGSHVSPASQGK